MSTPELTQDLSLIEGIAAGDRQHFDAFVERMRKLVTSVIYRVLNDPQDTEDVAQEVFAQVWNKAGLYVPSRGKPSTWVATLARNRAIDRLRSKQRRARLMENFTCESDPKAMEMVDASDIVATREQGAVVRDAVMKLSPQQRQAIEMAYFSGLTQSEIASKLDQPLGTVKARIRRGLGKLREVVTQD